MKTAIYYFIFKCYTWAKTSDRSTPMLGLVFAVGMFTAILVLTCASMIYVVSRVDALAFFGWFENKAQFIPVLLVWFGLHYALLEWGGLREAALKRFPPDIPNGGRVVVIAIAANCIACILAAIMYMIRKFG